MRILFIIVFLFTLNCSINKVSKIHGFRLIENKYDKLTLNEYNKNDISHLNAINYESI